MRFHKLFLIGAVIASTLALTSGCAYRTDLAQGNFVEQVAVDKLRYGMTMEQVQFILGSPMLTDPFDSTRWYYINSRRHKWEDAEVQRLVVLFENHRLVDISGDYTKPLDFTADSQSVQKIDLSSLSSEKAE